MSGVAPFAPGTTIGPPGVHTTEPGSEQKEPVGGAASTGIACAPSAGLASKLASGLGSGLASGLGESDDASGAPPSVPLASGLCMLAAAPAPRHDSDGSATAARNKSAPDRKVIPRESWQ